MTTVTRLKIAAWTLSTVVAALAFYVWLSGIHYHFSAYSYISYQLFPLFGLIAFSVMWSHYIIAAIRLKLGVNKQVLHRYFEVTSLVVLLAIALHPGILWFQLWKDGFGLPPQSYLQHYVAPSLRWAAVLGTVSWFVFLAYELRRKFSQKKWWPYLQYLSDAAMIAIFIHGLKLGKNLYAGWFQKVWYFYGLTLVLSLGYIYYQKFHHTKQV